LATLAELQEQLERLRAIRAGGAAACQVSGDQRVEYRSDRDIAAAIADLERQIAVLNGIAPVTTVLVSATKGLDA
jgi:hypothetical protein